MVAAARRTLRDRRGVCVFLGSRSGAQQAYIEAARALGKEIARQGFSLIYGGGDVGLMGELARSVHESGGTVVGVIPRALAGRELSGVGVQIDNTVVTSTMHERKQLMASFADAFIALPGGFGTMEEVVEAITWTQLGIHDKPVGLLNTCGFWEPMHQMFKHATSEGFINDASLDIVVMEADPAVMLDRVMSHRPPPGLATTWDKVDV
ncbi:Cytokinin riboside 5'-monophosphate phosphoribohydrolase [Hondaea fermentalgiana]|uniref:Cytokinin riboside 5'-monophosphate phosphoribohydrolase n=1 Tax=Hondaea fermentalgiana TaxID=2315210 RepID=A0A2R5GZ63_9STRA|nr:Cytokinin riboside 5'-monophosphate phosphoribohydrolase [Hondaea fermentalgiana]|eukprot:GBG33314.1 Cytokinin riboside 5'-monophosphate phosphoribohydrolase [Hondaea fermentalgiana]